MEQENDTLDAACLQVFGMISASVSHDLKNVLAIINESAGLLDDLALRAGKGVEIPPDRLGVATARILKQVKRGDVVLKNLNRFAHSTDAPILRSDAAETVALMVDLASRQIAMKELVVTTAPGVGAIRTCLVYFEAFVYLLLRRIIETLPRKETVEISVGQEGGMVVVRFSNAGGLPLLADDCFAEGRERALMTSLKMDMEAMPGVVSLRLPADIE